MTTHTHRRRYTAAFFALTLPLAMAACGAEDETLSEPEMTSPPAASAADNSAEETAAATTEAAKEETSERPSTTVSTIYETENEEAAAEDKGDKEAGAGAGSDKGPCEWKPVEEGEIGEEVSDYCDGRFASVGIYATDASAYMFWNGKEWEVIESAGQTYSGFKCYDEAYLEELGVPAELKEQMIICD